MRRVCPLLALLPILAGCTTEHPRAPALRDGPVYDNSLAGLRFLTPTNWNQVARSDQPPPGPGERLLVRFQAPPNVSHALFEVTVDAAPPEDVAALVKQPSHSAAAWEPVGAPAQLTIGGEPATRYTFKNKETTKEVVAVRRGGKLYLFTMIAATSDAESREQIRQVVGGVTWTK
jgi:hypothetical protein